MSNKFEQGLDINPANFEQLSPLSFIQRSAQVYPERPAVIHGQRRYTWSETYQRSVQLASALSQTGIGQGDVVAIMAANTPEMYEAHFGVPMSGAILNTLNIRLDAKALAFNLEHGEAKVLITDREFSSTIQEAITLLDRDITIINIDDSEYQGAGELIGDLTYEAFLQKGDPQFTWQKPEDEWQSITLNYTSGTTGNPKGVVYSHRGAYLLAIGNVLAWQMTDHPVYLWTLPMFHCNGWCFPWTLASIAGTSVCQRQVRADDIFDAIHNNGVNHLCGAPIVLDMIIQVGEAEDAQPLPREVKVLTAAAPPPASTLERISNLGFNVTHVYGLTETYGPSVMCAWKDEWDELDSATRAQMKSRQGVPYHTQEALMVANPTTMEPVPQDGKTIGEVMSRGNITMKGYLKNPTATEEAFAGGWFHTGDLGVWHPDGYIQLKDRAKDIIISGGENISSIEVEDAIRMHPEVASAAVVARPDEKWGETPCAYVQLVGGSTLTGNDIIDFCREHLARFKCPRHVIIGSIPTTSTGKIQKFLLREQAKQEAETE